MRTLLYHDVAPRPDWPVSGFAGGDADVYKLEPAAFDSHLTALTSLGVTPSLITGGQGSGDARSGGNDDRAWAITFDDGGESALSRIAPALEARGWRGHFFMTGGRIGTQGFLDRDGLRELAARGHVIGSHSMSHPLVMSACSHEQLLSEWKESVEALADVLGYRPAVASLPGGAFSRDVAETAAAAGIRVLFTSEPTAKRWHERGITCVGRFTVWNHMPPATACELATGRGLSGIRQRVLWETKKLTKSLLGRRYLAIRKCLLESGKPVERAT